MIILVSEQGLEHTVEAFKQLTETLIKVADVFCELLRQIFDFGESHANDIYVRSKAKPKYRPYKLASYNYIPRFVRNLPYQRRDYQGKNG